MMDALALLGPPFAVACCLVGIHTCFGLEVLKRNVVFVDLALAQIAALGATVAFMLGHPAQGLATYTWSLGFTLVAAALLAGTKAWSERISQEALIGVIYVVAAAAAVLLIDRCPESAVANEGALAPSVRQAIPHQILPSEKGGPIDIPARSAG